MVSRYQWMWYFNVICWYSVLALSKECIPRKFSFDSVVCVCNETYCDSVDKLPQIPPTKFIQYTSSLDGLRFHTYIGDTHKSSNSFNLDFVIEIDDETKYQRILGWGAHFTDATGYNIANLSPKAQSKLMHSYFSDEGNEYSLGRVPMGGTDFSVRKYTYADEHENDMSLKYFKLAPEDVDMKIPLILKARELTNGRLKLIAAPWTAPKWMKNSHLLSSGVLLRKYYQVYANYYVKFFESYEKYNISFWALSLGNEPTNGYIPVMKLPSMAWSPFSAATWLKTNLGPTIRKSDYKNLKIIIHDDQRLTLPALKWFFDDVEAMKYVDGVGVHWYSDFYTPDQLLSFAKTDNKELFYLMTEAAEGLMRKPSVALGSWKRAENYIKSIFTYLDYGFGGWMDWNLALGVTGGPVYTDYPVDSTIIVNATAGEFYKQPIFYAMGHFSKFIPPGSIRVKSSNHLVAGLLHHFQYDVFIRPDNKTVVVVYNNGNVNTSITIKNLCKSVTTETVGNSISTIVF